MFISLFTKTFNVCLFTYLNICIHPGFLQAQRTALEADELDSEAQQSTRIIPEEEKANPIFEEILKNLKEATGVSDLQV